LRDLGSELVLIRVERFGPAIPNAELLRIKGWWFSGVRRRPVFPVDAKLEYTENADNGSAPMPVVESMRPPEGILWIAGKGDERL
jgi:hypothetical protein